MDQKKNQRSFYDMLGIQRSCTSQEISEAWTNIKKTLPPLSQQYLSAEKAYTTLCDPANREMYDMFGFYGQGLLDQNYFTSGFLENDFIKSYQKIISQKYPKYQREISLSVTLEDLYNGKKTKVEYNAKTPCTHCRTLPCHCTVSGNPMTFCAICRDSKVIYACNTCHGSRFILKQIEENIIINPGMVDQQKLRSPGCCVTLNLKPHNIFKRLGDDLCLIKRINLTEALCGFQFVVNHLDNRKLLVTSASGIVTSSGCRKVVRGEGMPILNANNGEKGDLIVLFQVSMPQNVQISILKEIELLLPDRPDGPATKDMDLEEYDLTEFDPNYKLVSVTSHEAYYDEKDEKNPAFMAKELCTHQ